MFREASLAGARSGHRSARPAASARRVLGWLLGGVVRIWMLTLRVVVDAEAASRTPRVPSVYAFFHGQQMLLLGALDRRRVTVMVSHSSDGELQAGVMGRLGLSVVRGSSSRGGARALARLVRVLRGGGDVAFAVDGPRGPAGVAKAGAAGAAAASGAELLPVAAVASRTLVLLRAWDRFEIPLPFSRVVVVIGAPISAVRAKAEPALVASCIVEARARAASRSGVSEARVLRAGQVS